MLRLVCRSSLSRSAGVHPPLLARAASSSSRLPRGLSEVLEKKPDDVVITFAKRTAIGRAKKGQFKDTPPDQLLYALIKATLERTGLEPSKIDDVAVANCHHPTPLYMSRAATIGAGIPYTVPTSTLNRLCSSGLMSIRQIAHTIKANEANLGVAAAVESMSLNPRPQPVVVPEIEESQHAHDCMQPMGWTSEMVAEDFNISRETQDKYAYISHSRAEKAQAAGIFASEILPIELGGSIVQVDDTIRPGVTQEGLAALKPAFPKWGKAPSTTAGNASGISDGAGIVILTTRERAEREGLEILGKYVTTTVVGVEPKYMGISPVVAIPKVLEQVGLKREDVDVYEINEAFASQFAYCVKELNIPIEVINPNGGAIAISHPVSMTGIRQVATGLEELRRRNGKILCTSMCVGSGMGAAGIFVNERS